MKPNKAMWVIYLLAFIVLLVIFILPNPFTNVTFPYTDGVLVFDGYTRVDSATDKNAAIDKVNLLLWPGEREAFQILITKTEGLNEVMLTAHISPDQSPAGQSTEGITDERHSPVPSMPSVSLYLEDYIEITQTNIKRGQLGEYPDALIPWPLQEFRKLDGAKSATIYVEIVTDQFSQPGAYTGEVVINAGGKANHIPFEISILDWHIDSAPLPFAVGVSDSNFSRFISSVRGEPTDLSRASKIESIYENFAAQLYEARAFPTNFDSFFHPEVSWSNGEMNISYNRLDSAFYTYLAKTSAKQFPFNIHDALGNSGIIRGGLLSDMWTTYAGNYIADVAEHFRANGWMDEAYCYVLDEPNTIEDYESAARLGLFLKEIAPDLPFLLTEQPYRLPKQSDWPDLTGIVDVWCPQLAYYRTAECVARQQAGDRMWIYPNQRDFTEFTPEIASPTLNIGDEFLAPQILTAIIYRHRIDGLLYWDCIYWKHADSFENPNPSGDTDREFFGNGDGVLFYAGDVISKHLPGFPDINGPIPTLRWKNLVQGLEDYRLFKYLNIDPDKIPDSPILLSDPAKYKQFIDNLKTTANR